MKNITTPRTLAECEFTSGYAMAYPQSARTMSRAEQIASIALAVAIGVGLAAALVVWWST